MPTIALMYHDVIEAGNSDVSGFPGAGAAVYKLTAENFGEHLDAIAAAIGANCVVTVRDAGGDALSPAQPVLLTFDDGGVSAATVIAPALERRGWRGHFFVTTERIGHPAFLPAALIRDLAARGHVIGSHSHTHPTRMAACSADQLLREWKTSCCILSDILARPVSTASVPGGYYSADVARVAAFCGIRTLFTSEPTTRIHFVDGCRIIGRYTVWRQYTAETAAALASGRSAARLKQAAAWNAKKAAKRVGGHLYLTLRESLLSR